jgi:hypothetical protein
MTKNRFQFQIAGNLPNSKLITWGNQGVIQYLFSFLYPLVMNSNEDLFKGDKRWTIHKYLNHFIQTLEKRFRSGFRFLFIAHDIREKARIFFYQYRRTIKMRLKK